MRACTLACVHARVREGERTAIQCSVVHFDKTFKHLNLQIYTFVV